MNVRYYSREASTRYEWDKAKQHMTENDVPNWRSIHISDTDVIRAATETSRTLQQYLSKIASVYLTKFLGFSVQVPVADAVEKAFFFKKPTAMESSADLHVKERVSPEDYQDYLEKKKLDFGNNPPVGQVVPGSVPNPALACLNLSDKNPARPTLAGKSKIQKIRILASMYESDKLRQPCTFTMSYRALYYTKVKPVGRCLALCFDGDIELFDQKLDQLPIKGTYKCCSDSHHCKESSS